MRDAQGRRRFEEIDVEYLCERFLPHDDDDDAAAGELNIIGAGDQSEITGSYNRPCSANTETHSRFASVTGPAYSNLPLKP